MQSKLILGALLGIFLTLTFDYDHAVVFKLTNAVSESYKLFGFAYCHQKAVSRSKVILNMNGTIFHPAHDVNIHGRVFKRANGYKPWLIDISFDACLYFRKRNQPIVNLVYGLFREFTNINHTCPYVGPQILKDFYLKPELLRLPIPPGDYMLTLQWYFDKKLQFDTNVSFTIVEDLMNRN